MLDIHLLRSQPEIVASRLAARAISLILQAFVALEEQRKAVQIHTQELQAKRNALSKQVGQLKSRGEDASSVLAEVSGIGDELKANELALSDILRQINEFVAVVPNLPHDSVPPGNSDADNALQKSWGTPRTLDFRVKDHVDLGGALGGLDFETAAKTACALFAHERCVRDCIGARPVHAGLPHRRARLYGSLCALPGQRGLHVRNRATAQFERTCLSCRGPMAAA